jgi:hypothetical protein
VSLHVGSFRFGMQAGLRAKWASTAQSIRAARSASNVVASGKPRSGDQVRHGPFG